MGNKRDSENLTGIMAEIYLNSQVRSSKLLSLIRRAGGFDLDRKFMGNVPFRDGGVAQRTLWGPKGPYWFACLRVRG